MRPDGQAFTKSVAVAVGDMAQTMVKNPKSDALKRSSEGGTPRMSTLAVATTPRIAPKQLADVNHKVNTAAEKAGELSGEQLTAALRHGRTKTASHGGAASRPRKNCVSRLGCVTAEQKLRLEVLRWW